MRPIEQPTPEASTAPAPALVHIFNRTPATYKHGDIVVPPGGESEVPANVADIWRRVSQGHVSSAKHNPGPSALEAALRAEQAKSAAAERKANDLEQRLADLEKKYEQGAKARR
jgi:hypothetical protein